MTAEFRASLGHASELCQVDWRGDIVDRDKQTRFCAAVPVRCRTEDKKIDIGFWLHVEVDLNELEHVPPDSRLIAVAHAAVEEAIPRLAKYAPWQLYGPNGVRIPSATKIAVPAETYEVKRDHSLAPSVVDQLAKATAFHAEVSAGFESAKKFLDSNLDWLRDDPHRARSTAMFLAECMRSDGAPMMGMWNREKAGRLVDEVNDLIRRRNRNHPGYVSAAHSISSILYMIHAPTVWAKHPPSPALLRL